MEEISKDLEKIQKFLKDEVNPFVILLFGSYVRGSQNNESDIDIAIFAENVDKKMIFKLKQKLEDIVSKDIDLINLNDDSLSEGFKYEILMSGKVLYCTDTYKFEMYKLDEFREYLDFNESRQPIINRLKEGGTIYGK